MTTAIANLSQADIAAFDAMIEPWCTAMLERDWDTALGMCTEDCTFLPPGAPAVPAGQGRAFFEAYPVIKAFTFDFSHVDGGNDFATLQGSFDMTIESDSGEVTALGKFVDVVRKETDGNWRFSCIIWNEDAA